MSTRNIPNTRQILCTTAPHQYDAVLLQVMTFALNVCHDRISIRELHTRDLALRRVGFFGSHDKHLGANTLLLRTVIKERRFRLGSILGLLAPHRLIQCHGEQRRGVEGSSRCQAVLRHEGPCLGCSATRPQQGQHCK